MKHMFHEFLRASYAAPAKRQKTISGYVYNPDYSDSEVAVYTRDGKAVFVARGSQPPKWGGDWFGKRGNVANEFGYNIREGDQYANLTSKRQKLDHDGYDVVAIGHSRGAALVDQLNQDKPFSHVFDVNGPDFWDKHDRASNQTSIRSALDPVSATNPRAVSQKRSWTDIYHAAKSFDTSPLGIAETANYYLGQHAFESIDFGQWEDDFGQFFSVVHGPESVGLDPVKLGSSMSALEHPLHNFGSLANMSEHYTKKRSGATVGRRQKRTHRAFVSTQVPRRSLSLDYSFQMGCSAGMKQNCFNVFRHQEVDVLRALPTPTVGGFYKHPSQEDSAKVLFSGQLDKYVLRGYGHSDNPDPSDSTNDGGAIQCYNGQAYIGPKNSKGGTLNDVTLLNAGSADYVGCAEDPDDVVGGQDISVSRGYALKPVTVYPIPRLTGATSTQQDFVAGAISQARASNDGEAQGYDTGVILPENVMALCPTLWSPVCQQSMEVAAANLAGKSEQGTIASLKDALSNTTGVEEPTAPFSLTDIDTLGDKHPRNLLDPYAASMCVNDHSCTYKFRNNGGTSAVVEFKVFKVHGLDSGTSSIPPTRTVLLNNSQSGAFYPGFNSAYPFFSPTIFVGGGGDTETANPTLSTLYQRTCWLDKWLCAKAARIHGTTPTATVASTPATVGFDHDPVFVLPNVSVVQGGPNSYGSNTVRTIDSTYSRQLATRCWWPLANAKFNFHPSVTGVRMNDNMRMVGMKSFSLRQGQSGSYNLNMGGFTYRFSDIAQFFGSTLGVGTTPYVEQNVQKPKAYGGPINLAPRFVNSGCMNGSVCVMISVKGCVQPANALVLDAYQDKLLQVPGNDPETTQALPLSYASGDVSTPANVVFDLTERVKFSAMTYKRKTKNLNTYTKQDTTLLVQPYTTPAMTVRVIGDNGVRVQPTGVAGVANTGSETKGAEQPIKTEPMTTE